MKAMQGTIISLKTPQTAQVAIVRQWQHPLYKKSVKRSRHYACHYEEMTLAEGDSVLIESCKPMSKTKKFRIVKVVEKV